MVNKPLAMNIPTTPVGFHSLQAYFTVRDAAKAIQFYCELFGGEEILRLTMPDGKTLMHAEVRIGDSVLMLSEENLEWGNKSPATLGGSPVSVMHYVPAVDDVFAKAVAMGCQPIIPPAEMFWGDRFCKFVDPFGHIWAVATHLKDPTPEEMEAGRKAMFEGDCA